MDIQSIAAFVFIGLLTLFFFVNKKKFHLVKIFYPFLYFAMYKTKLGLKSMDSWSKKCPRIMKLISNGGIVIGFLGMIFITYELIRNTVNILTKPDAVPGVGLVLPFEVKGAFYVPFFYWITSIFIIAVIHEFTHGLIARYHNMPLKSSGFAFLGILIPVVPAAFVEPNEKIMMKRPAKQQLGVYAAGPVSNIITGILFFLMIIFIAIPMVHTILDFDGVQITGLSNEKGIIYPAEKAGVQKNEIILEINNNKINTLSNFTDLLQNKHPGDEISLKTDKADYSLQLANHPLNSSNPYMGVMVTQHSIIKKSFEDKYGKTTANFLLWISGRPERNGLLFWLYALSLGIGFINLAPLGPLDGGKMLQAALLKYFPKEKANKYWKYIGVFFLLLLIINLGFSFIK